MKRLNFVLAFYIVSHFCCGQQINVDSAQVSAISKFKVDSMMQLLEHTPEGTSRCDLLGIMSYQFSFFQADKAVSLGQEGSQLSQKLGYKKGMAKCTQSLGMAWWGLGNYSNALQAGISAVHMYEELGVPFQVAFTHNVIASVYRDFGDYSRAMDEARKASAIYKTIGASEFVTHGIKGSIFDLQDQLDSAYYHVQKAYELNELVNNNKWPWLYYLKGNIFRKRKQYDSAMHYYRTGLPLVYNKDLIETYNGIALLYYETGQIDSCIYYASQVLQKWKHVSYQRGILQSSNILADAYKKINQRDSAIKYFELGVALNSSMFDQREEREIQNLAFNEQLRQDEEIRERKEYQDSIKMYVLGLVGLFLLTIALLLWRNVRHNKKVNLVLVQQKNKIEDTLRALTATQSQLIQSEKMASLGELTAGIAHEIQNPLNFVNNFSEVNKELLSEMKDEIEKGNFEEAKSLAGNVISNQEKINEHGKRADAIVKGMLQHSRSSSGTKEPTDINALTDEHVKLAYHALRAKDKRFNVRLETDFDEHVGKASVVPQDIGRVILNLVTNAFYTVTEKKNKSGSEYEPTVTVRTKRTDDQILISVVDNGNGISSKVLDKIFQPFFTTKPAGQGTGLGLSLSYDIIKAQGGDLRVETKEGQGSEFVVSIVI